MNTNEQFATITINEHEGCLTRVLDEKIRQCVEQAALELEAFYTKFKDLSGNAEWKCAKKRDSC